MLGVMVLVLVWLPVLSRPPRLLGDYVRRLVRR